MTTIGARKGLLSILTGNTPAVRGELVGRLSRRHPEAVALSVSIQAAPTGRYPAVQRLMRPDDLGTNLGVNVSSGTTGDPTVILRQDLIALRRAKRDVHVLLALPQEVDTLPFLLRLWRSRIGADSLEDHYDCSPVLAAVDPLVFLENVTDVRHTARLWEGAERSEPFTAAEVAVRQVEAADALLMAAAAPDTPRAQEGAAAHVRHLNPRALVAELRQFPTGDSALTEGRSPKLLREAWASSLEAVTWLPVPADPDPAVSSFVWRARRPLHPGRLAEGIGAVMLGVLRSRGHLWLSNRPDAVISWRSAGPHLDLRETGRWLEEADARAWQAASAQRRTLASWFWDGPFGERRSEIGFTGAHLDIERIARELDAALLTDAELALGRASWSDWTDPLFSHMGQHRPPSN
ncbi:GTP-binding protein [Streptomyces sp. YH02]|uniref:GTP-binding protein n=1 Tax=Streptomyces sp. YH02 TaxID=3256999 RepID=UPI003757B077